jgi:hypothetical protein
MAEFLSPGVTVTEIDASTIAPTVSNSIGVFSGSFSKGAIGQFRLITTIDELISFYGEPTNTNYNDWYQCYNFLQYGNKLYIARAGSEVVVQSPATQGTWTLQSVTIVSLSGDQLQIENLSNEAAGFNVGDVISFDSTGELTFTITANNNVPELATITLDSAPAIMGTPTELYKLEVAQ